MLGVTQTFSLPYRRFAIGRPSARSEMPELAGDPQNTILRYDMASLNTYLGGC